jgi:hypothetical protein
MVFASCSKEDVIYPLTVKEIAQAQQCSPQETKQSRQVFHSIVRGYTSPMQKWQDGHPQSSSAESS